MTDLDVVRWFFNADSADRPKVETVTGKYLTGGDRLCVRCRKVFARGHVGHNHDDGEWYCSPDCFVWQHPSYALDPRVRSWSNPGESR